MGRADAPDPASFAGFMVSIWLTVQFSALGRDAILRYPDLTV
jgi:hypothetical protein